MIPFLRNLQLTLFNCTSSAAILLVVVVFVFVFATPACVDRAGETADSDSAPELSPETLANQVAASLTEEETLSLADELRVRPGELALFDYWDTLRTANQPILTLAKLPITAISLPENTTGSMAQILANEGEWSAKLSDLKDVHGYTLKWSHFEHVSFDAQSNPPQSLIRTEFHFGNGSRRSRTILKADMAATWGIAGPGEPGAQPFTDASLRITEIAEGKQPAFHELQAITIPTIAEQPVLATSLLVRDLNRDHFPEVILPGANILLWNQANCSFVEQPLCCVDSPRVFRAGAFGEFTGDVHTDLILVDSYGGLCILPGDPAGAFMQEPIPVTPAPVVENATRIAVADIDGDGDSDIYIAQDKPMFVGGQMPSPANNALSGNPDYLLRNDGALQFTDISDASGLDEKKYRRTKDAVFCDYDDDGDADLVLAGAFAPVDVLENRDGQFVDISTSALAGRAAPLMANRIALTDLDGDGLRDIAIAATASSAGARIEAVRERSDRSPLSEGAEFIPITASSSRLLGNRERTVVATGSAPSNRRVFETIADFSDAGWANDLTHVDYDNDGDLDTYVANGNISGKSTRDYDLYFWQRELRAATALEDPVIAILFTDPFRPEPFRGLNEGQISWQGHQANRFYRNEGTAQSPSFRETAYLAGAALTADSRATEAADLDLDGKVDLLVVTQDWTSENGSLVPRQQLTVLRNQITTSQSWIGFKLDNAPAALPPSGTTVTLEWKERAQTLAFADGASTLHLGLGKQKAPERVTIHWPDGTAHYIDAPPIDRYISVEYALE